MRASRVVGILLIVAGAISLAYGGFTYTKRTDAASVGPISVTVQHQQTVSIPVWVGVGVILIGGLMLALGERKG